jgi:hypothetical protein
MVADDNPSGESCRGGHRGAPVEQRCRTPMERLPKKRSAAMSAHVLLSEHKQTSRGHRQIDAIDPKQTTILFQTPMLHAGRAQAR